MLVLRRIAREPHSGAAYEIHEALHALFRVRVTITRGVTVDEKLLYPTTEWTGDGARPQVEVVLAGRLKNTQGKDVRWLSPGQYAIGRSLDDLWARVEDDSLVLSVDWALGSLSNVAPAGLPTGVVTDPVALTTAARAFVDGAALELEPVLETLRASGVPLDPIVPGDELLEEHDRVVANALTRAMSNLAESPMSVDLEQTLGRSRRQVVELIRRVATRLRLNGEDWRSLRDRWRLSAAAVLATHRHATTENVAAAVGYGSARALCTALSRAGLPSPSNMRRAVEALR